MQDYEVSGDEQDDNYMFTHYSLLLDCDLLTF